MGLVRLSSDNCHQGYALLRLTKPLLYTSPKAYIPASPNNREELMLAILLRQH